MTTKTIPPAVLAAEAIWFNAVKARNYVLVFSQHGYFGNDVREAANLLVKAQIATPLKENRVLGCRSYQHSLIITAAVQKAYRVAEGATVADLAPKVREALLKQLEK